MRIVPHQLNISKHLKSFNHYSKVIIASAFHKQMDMTRKLPAQRMAVSPDKSLLVLAISSHLQVFDLSTCQLISSTNNPDLNTNGSNHNALIRLLVIHQNLSSSGERKSMVLISTGEDKLLKTWELPSLKLINSRELIKRATSIAVSPNGKNIVISDKFGDVYNLPFDAPLETVFQSDPDQEQPSVLPTSENCEKLNSKTENLKSHCKPVLPIAGHVSLLTSLTFIPSLPSPLLVTADRDEHIRISRYPQAWSIFSYLLGHTKFIASLLWVESPNQQEGEEERQAGGQCPQGRLLSAGGDDEIYVWDYLQNLCAKKIVVKGLANGMKVWPHKQTWFAKTRNNKRRRKSVVQNDQDLNKSSLEENKKNEDSQHDETILEVEESRQQQSQPFVQRTCVNKMICTSSSKRNEEGYILATSIGSSTLAVISSSCLFDNQIDCPETTRYHDIGLPILDIVDLSDHNVLLSLDNSFSSAGSDPSPSTPSPLFRILTLHPNKIEESSAPTSSSLNQLASIEVSKELPIPSQETLYSELILFTKEDLNSNQLRQQDGRKEEGGGKSGLKGGARGGRSGKKVEGRLLSQKRCETVLAQSNLKKSSHDS